MDIGVPVKELGDIEVTPLIDAIMSIDDEAWLANNHRVIEKDNLDLVMTHVAVEYDRTAWQQDINTILPIDRLEEMAKNGEIGSVSNEHYSFIGSSDPIKMERSAKEVAERICQDKGSKKYGILSVIVKAFYDSQFFLNKIF